MQRESIECLVMAWHTLTVRYSSRFGGQLRYTLIYTLVIVTIKLPITKPIRILNFNSISILNIGI
jgi:hypothetical protein